MNWQSRHSTASLSGINADRLLSCKLNFIVVSPYSNDSPAFPKAIAVPNPLDEA
jgi:hypothetical protein